jgi:hypothetical protein
MIEQDLVNFIFNNQVSYDLLDEDLGVYEPEVREYLDSIFHYRDIIKNHKFTTPRGEEIKRYIKIKRVTNIRHSGRTVVLDFGVNYCDRNGDEYYADLTMYYINFKYARLEYLWDDDD